MPWPLSTRFHLFDIIDTRFLLGSRCEVQATARDHLSFLCISARFDSRRLQMIPRSYTPTVPLPGTCSRHRPNEINKLDHRIVPYPGDVSRVRTSESVLTQTLTIPLGFSPALMPVY